MKFKLDVTYSEEEHKFLEEHNCAILSEIKLSKVDFLKHEAPRRMFQYGGTYISETFDDESDGFMWAVLSKWKGVWHFTEYYDTLEGMAQGI